MDILARFAINRRVISALMTQLILLAGYYAYTQLPRFEDPEFIIRQAQIITAYPGASAREVTEEVTDVIENAIQQLSGVKEIKSVSSVGLSEVTVQFTIKSSKDHQALNQKFTQLRAKISDTQGTLPPNTGTPMVYDDFGDVYALYFAVTGDGYSLPELYAYAKELQKQLVLVDGVSKVRLNGVPEEVIYVEYSPSRLARLGLAAEQIENVLKGQNLVTPAGSIEAGDVKIAIRPLAGVVTLEAIENLVITNPETGATVRLRDLATVSRGTKKGGFKPLFRSGKPAIGLGISNTLGGNVVNMGEAIKKRIAELEADRPLGIEIEPISDQSKSVKLAVNDFVVNVALALIIVVGTLLVFMGLRSGLLMGGILLVTVAGTLLGMYAFGLNMQRISLGALIIALGMLVDNAIVVVEATLVRVNKGEDAASAAIDVVKRTNLPLLGGTVVGILAFSPIGFSPDNTGEYAGSLFWTILISLMFSWLIAIWLTPYYCTLMMKKGDASTDVASQKEHWILGVYRKLLSRAVEWRWATVAVVVGLFAAAVASFSAVPEGFFPASTRPQFVVDYYLPEGTDIDRTKRDISEIDGWIRKLDGVTGTNAIVGSGHQRFMLIYDSESPNPAYGQILVDVADFTEITDLIPQIQNHVDTNYPDSSAKVWKFVLGPGGGSLVEARFTGPNPVVLRRLSNDAKAIFSRAGAIGVQDDWREKTIVVRPKINDPAARRAGLTQGDISQAIAAFYDGATIGVFREGDELRSIVFRPYASDRSDINQIRNVQIFSPASKRFIPISQVVDSFDVVKEDAKLRRFNRSLAIVAQADPKPGESGPQLFQTVRSDVEAIPLPQGYELEWRGQYGNSQDANAGLASTMPFGFGAMIVVVLLLFNAIRQPLIIWLTVPLAIIGVVFGLIALNTPLEFVAILAILSLTGMLIKNAIVLIDETDQQIEEGKARMSAVIDAAVSRVRPVGLGVLTTVLGVVPLLWDPFFRSLAVVIICGLSFATILTLVIVPTLYAVFFKVRGDEVDNAGT